MTYHKENYGNSKQVCWGEIQDEEKIFCLFSSRGELKMTASDWKKIYNQLRNKPAKLQKFIKHCKPKDRKFGIAAKKCQRCGRLGAHLSQYGLNFCRQCFREIAEEIGFKKYS